MSWVSFGDSERLLAAVGCDMADENPCDRRFFAVHAMKLILGSLLVQYDIEPLKERPEFTVFAEALIPKDETKIKMRRRVAKV